MYIVITIFCAVIMVAIPILMTAIGSWKESMTTATPSNIHHRAILYWRKKPRTKVLLVILFVILLLATIMNAILAIAYNSYSIRLYTIGGNDHYPLTVGIEDDIPIGDLYYTLDGTNPSNSSTVQRYTGEFILNEKTLIIAQRRFLGMFLGESSTVFDSQGHWNVQGEAFVNSKSVNVDADKQVEIDQDMLAQLSDDEIDHLYPWSFVGMVTMSGSPTDTLIEKYEFVGFDWIDGEMTARTIWNHYIRQPANTY